MKKRFITIFYALFAVCFAFVMFNAIAHNASFKTPWLIGITTVCLAMLAVIYRVIGRYENGLGRSYNKILIIFAAILFAVNVLSGLILRYDPMWDVGAVQKGAIEWVETGTFRGYYDYFSSFPNNLGAMAFLAVFLKIASFFGITDYFAVGVVITSAMISAAAVLVSLICRRLGGVRQALFALSLFAVSAQYWFIGGAVYTDSMSMMFPVLIYWLYLKSKDMQGGRKILMYVLMGISASIGALNKITVLIMAAAVIIDMCFNEKPKDIIKSAVCIAVAVSAVQCGFNAYIYSNHLTREMNERKARPYIHWVMMGLEGEGKYNAKDYEFTDSFPTLAERRQKDGEEALKRVKELGVSGMLKLISRKSAIDFGDGTYGSTDCFWLSPKYKTKLHDWVISDNKHYNKYGTYVSSMHLAIMLLMLLFSITLIFGKNEDKSKYLALYVSVFGVWLFLMCWETNRRYFVNFAPVIFVLGTLGMGSFQCIIDQIKPKTKLK